MKANFAAIPAAMFFDTSVVPLSLGEYRAATRFPRQQSGD
jgi:hypothetical protein